MPTGIYIERTLEAPTPRECDLVEVDAQLIPALLSAIAGRLGPSHWATPEAWTEGYSRLSRQGAELLMGCKEDIITELRAARDGTPTHADYSLDAYPVGEWPGASLQVISGELYAAPDTAAELLVQIRDLLTQQASTDGDALEMLGQIVVLLGV